MKRRPPADLAAALERYAALLRRYHGTLDLMSDTGLARLDEHVADALAYADVVATLVPEPSRLMDLGSGAGLPGIVLAAALPELEIELVERRRKRASFLRMAAAAVGRPDVVVQEADVRQTHGSDVDVVTAQAVGRLSEVLDLVRRRASDPLVLVARKGDGWREEIADLARRQQAEMPSATAELVEARPLQRGTLVAVRVQGGRPCRSSA